MRVNHDVGLTGEHAAMSRPTLDIASQKPVEFVRLVGKALAPRSSRIAPSETERLWCPPLLCLLVVHR